MAHANLDPHAPRLEDYFLTRREFLHRFGTGFGALALAGMMGPELVQQASGQESAGLLSPKQPHFAPKAKRVVHIFMNGAQSHLDTWDPKPELAKRSGDSVAGEGMRGG